MLVFSNKLYFLTFAISLSALLLSYSEFQVLSEVDDYAIIFKLENVFYKLPAKFGEQVSSEYDLDLTKDDSRVVVHFYRLSYIRLITFSHLKGGNYTIGGMCLSGINRNDTSSMSEVYESHAIEITQFCFQIYIKAALKHIFIVDGYHIRIENYLGCFKSRMTATPKKEDDPHKCLKTCSEKYFGVGRQKLEEPFLIPCECERNLLKYNYEEELCSNNCSTNWYICGDTGSDDYNLFAMFTTGDEYNIKRKNPSDDCLYNETVCPPCADGRKGFYCEQFGCTENPCPNKMECLKLIGNYWSCFCSRGYYMDENQTCVDLDECAEGTHTCDLNNSMCKNDEPYYHCVCNLGYVWNLGALKCLDVNECLEAKCDSKTSRCNNTIGSYSCVCLDGYEPIDLLKCKDVDECLEETKCDSNTTSCNNTEGSYKCVCLDGYEPLNLLKCKDVDECAELLHTCNTMIEICVNDKPGFVCICKPGYVKDSGNVSCLDIDECSQNKCNPISTSCHNRPGSFECKCLSGFSYYYNYSCTDDDECTEEICDSVTSTCRNQPGSFVCQCLDGYSHLTQFKCKDVDECGENKCDYKSTLCFNTIGSFECRCLFGFSNLEGSQCQDNNECADSTHDCEIVTTSCSNTDGSYECMCNSGFTRLSSTKCQDRDECLLLIHDCGKKSNCENTIGSYTCNCPLGTEKFTYQYLVECQDIDECRESESCDTSTSVCINMIPGFVCMCLPGFSSIDNFTCIRSVPKGTLTTSTDDYPNHKTMMTQDATQWTTDENENYDFDKIPILILILFLIIIYAAWFFLFQFRRSTSSQVSMSTAASEYSYDTSSND